MPQERAWILIACLTLLPLGSASARASRAPALSGPRLPAAAVEGASEALRVCQEAEEDAPLNLPLSLPLNGPLNWPLNISANIPSEALDRCMEKQGFVPPLPGARKRSAGVYVNRQAMTSAWQECRLMVPSHEGNPDARALDVCMEVNGFKLPAKERVVFGNDAGRPALPVAPPTATHRPTGSTAHAGSGSGNATGRTQKAGPPPAPRR